MSVLDCMCGVGPNDNCPAHGLDAQEAERRVVMNSPIPKIFHRIWLDEPMNTKFDVFWRRFQTMHPGWEFKTWGNSMEVRALIDDPEVLALWDHWIAIDPYGRIPDIARYLILREHGGVYLDTDMEPLRCFDDLVADDRPFVGWEDDKGFCTAVLASPARHPAIQVLLDHLAESMREHASSPIYETGPRFCMREWVPREDVRRLPPVYFYPVHWSKTRDLWRPYPQRSYAVHHWAAGWQAPAHAPEKGKITRTHLQDISLIVPMGEMDEQRTQVWDWLREYWGAFLSEAQIIVGINMDRPFNRAAAINAGVQRADGDYLVIVDADAFIPPSQIRQATHAISTANHRWACPFGAIRRLTQAQTQSWLEAQPGYGPDVLPKEAESVYTRPCGLGIVLHKRSWQAVNGMDDRFHGWGQEDHCFIRALSTLVGVPMQIEGAAYHMWHQRIGEGMDTRWPGQTTDNLALDRKYKAAMGRKMSMHKLVQEHGHGA